MSHIPPIPRVPLEEGHPWRDWFFRLGVGLNETATTVGTITPATTVVSETSAGQAAAVGTSLNYAREDHTHGTPAAGGGTTITTQDEGGTLSATVTTLNFTGAGVTASGAGATTTVNIPATTSIVGITGTIAEFNTAITDANITPTSRTISTTAPLSGGGDLSADRTLTTSMATNKLIGRGTAGTGVMEEITLGTNLSMTGTTLNASGGSGSGPVSGTCLVDFGATPTDEASLVITGLTDMTTATHIWLYVQDDDTSANNAAIDHTTLGYFSKCSASARVAATGFTANIRLLAGRAIGIYKLHYSYVPV